MSNRYYFTCPIKALYMMKEFGVKFECKDANGEFYDFQEWFLNSNNISELSLELENFPISIYVKKESEHIFEPKDDDLILHSSPDSDDDAYKLWKSDIGSVWLKKYFSKTIMRDNKQFFMPEVEND